MLDQHFQTDHLLGDLRRRTVSGGLITAFSQGGKFTLNLLSAVVLARLLAPSDFGLIAMVGVIATFLRVFKDAGLSTATVQKDKITHAQVSNLFWANVVLSAAMSIGVAASAPIVAWFFRDSRLIMVTLVLALTFAISGVAVQHQALLKRQMRFKAIALIEIGSAATGLVVAIVMALLGCTYWSLLGMQFFTTVADVALTFSVSKWRPGRFVRRSGTRPLFQFGASLTVAGLLGRIASGSDTLLIGRFYGADAVGLYSRGLILLLRPIEQLISPIEAVITPILSRMQNDAPRYRRTFLQVYGVVAMLSFPAAGLITALSRPLVTVLLGPKWDQVIPIFSWFTVVGLFWPLYCLGVCALNTQGRGKDIMQSGLIFSITTVGAFVTGLPFGPVGVAASCACVGLFVRLPIQNFIIGRQGPVSTADLWNVAIKYLPNGVFVGGVTFLIFESLPPQFTPITQLSLCVPAGTITAFLTILGVPSQRQEALRVWELLKPIVFRFRQ